MKDTSNNQITEEEFMKIELLKNNEKLLQDIDDKLWWEIALLILILILTLIF